LIYVHPMSYRFSFLFLFPPRHFSFTSYTRIYEKPSHIMWREWIEFFQNKKLVYIWSMRLKCRVSCHVIHTVEMSFWIDIYVYMKRFWQNDEQNQTFLSYHNNCVNCKKINQKSAKVMVRKRQNKQKWFIEKLCCFHPLTCYCSWAMNTYTRKCLLQKQWIWWKEHFKLLLLFYPFFVLLCIAILS